MTCFDITGATGAKPEVSLGLTYFSKFRYVSGRVMSQIKKYFVSAMAEEAKQQICPIGLAQNV